MANKLAALKETDWKKVGLQTISGWETHSAWLENNNNCKSINKVSCIQHAYVLLHPFIKILFLTVKAN